MQITHSAPQPTRFLSSPTARKRQAATLLENDQRIEHGARALLSDSGYRSLSAIECTADGDVLSLNGYVDTFYHKQIAQEIARRVAGVRHVKNEIQVHG